jgi:hypothetical protein
MKSGRMDGWEMQRDITSYYEKEIFNLPGL